MNGHDPAKLERFRVALAQKQPNQPSFDKNKLELVHSAVENFRKSPNDKTLNAATDAFSQLSREERVANYAKNLLRQFRGLKFSFISKINGMAPKRLNKKFSKRPR